MRRLAVMAVLVAASVLAPGVATAQQGSRQSAELTFAERAPNTPTGFDLRIDYVNPANPGAKPPSVRQVIERLAAGARLDTSVPAACTATDLVLILRGPNACPHRSRVGSGTITVDTGIGSGPIRFLRTSVVFLNNANQLIFVARERITGLRLVFRARVSDGEIVNSAPFLPGMPPDGAAIDVVDVRINRVTDPADPDRGYVTTPPECPDDGAWESSLEFRYADGIVQTVIAPSLCDGV